MASKSTISVRILGDNKDLSRSLDDSESKIGAFAANAGKIAAAAAVAVGGAVVVGLGKGFSDALGAQDNDALIAARLGLDPERAAELGDVAASAYRSAWGDSLAATTDVVTGLSSSFEGLNDVKLEALTGQAIALADTFGIDVDQAIQTTSELLQSGLVGSADEAFDLLTRGLQEMPQGIRDELLAASNEYGDFFGDLGLSGDVAFAKLAEYAEGGVYGIDKFGDALKELTIRGTDMSTASVAAYEAAGLSAEDMSARFLAGGDTARVALEDTAAALLSIEDPTERANAAIALFGTPLEDLSVSEIPGFLEGLTDMSAGLGDVDGAAQNMADTVGGTTSAKLESFKRRALGGLADFAANNLLPPFESFLEWGEKNWPKIQDTVEDAFAAIERGWERYGEPVFDAIIDVGGDVVDFFVDAWPGIQDAVSGVFDWIKDNKDVVIGALVGVGVAVTAILVPAFIAWAGAAASAAAATLLAAAPFIAIGAALAAIGAAAVWAYQNVGWFRDAVDAVASFFVDTVWPILQTTWDVITTVVEGIVTTVRDNWDTIHTIVVTVFNEIKGFVETVWNAMWGIVSGYIEIIRGVIETATSLIKGDWSGVWEGIKGILSGAWEVIKSTVSGAIDLVVGWVKAVPGRIFGVAYTMFNAISDNMGTVRDWIKERAEDFIGAVLALPGKLIGKFVGMFDGIKNAFKGAINFIIDGWNNLSFTLPEVDTHIPGVGKIGGWTLSTPNIPRLHTGIDRVPGRRGEEMLAILEAGERVVPASENTAAREVASVEASPFGSGNVWNINTKDDPKAIRAEMEAMMWAAGAR